MYIKMSRNEIYIDQFVNNVQYVKCVISENATHYLTSNNQCEINRSWRVFDSESGIFEMTAARAGWPYWHEIVLPGEK